jgi:acetyl esterase/lipase
MRQKTGYARTIERRPSLRSIALNALLRMTMRERLTHDADVVALRRKYEKLDIRKFRPEADVTRTPVDCGAVPAEWLSVRGSREERVLLYLHGGSFAFHFPNAYAALTARLCRQLGTRALIPDYRLAPEHPFPAGPDDCEIAYRWLLRRRSRQHRARRRFGRRQPRAGHAAAGPRGGIAAARVRGAPLACARLHDVESQHGVARGS